MLYRDGIPVMGKMMVLEGCILFVPLLVLPFYPKEIVFAWQFLLPAAVSIVLGVIVCHRKKEKQVAAGWWLLHGCMDSYLLLFHSGCMEI
ncbi:hypothetical protein ACQRBH_05485 [Bariatricus sp. SGI.161]|uniref:hypothetical protein n=1 Tax=Bariatricus sp. SGI.161 TaxID=3420550 RepID=UPI002A8A0CD8|nr:hypothetical protein [Oliverpabstia sp.]